MNLYRVSLSLTRGLIIDIAPTQREDSQRTAKDYKVEVKIYQNSERIVPLVTKDKQLGYT